VVRDAKMIMQEDFSIDELVMKMKNLLNFNPREEIERLRSF